MPYSAFPLDANFVTNLISSFEAYLNTKIITPYNTAVSGTTYAQPVTCIMDDPDDYSVAEQVPVIVLDYTADGKEPVSTGVGDHEMWVYPYMSMKVYPGLVTDTATGSEKPARQSANILRSLFAQITVGLCVPLYDFTQSSTTPVSFAYIDSAKVSETKGPMKDMLAMEKFRFNFDMRLRLMVEGNTN